MCGAMISSSPQNRKFLVVDHRYFEWINRVFVIQTYGAATLKFCIVRIPNPDGDLAAARDVVGLHLRARGFK